MTLPASGAITFSQIDVELGYSATAQIGMNCSAVRTLFGQSSGAICMNTGHGKSNTSVPGAPTGVSASTTSCSAISVSFSAPSCTGHLTIDSYQVVCTSSGSNSATGSSSPISVSGLSASTSYTFKVRAHNSKGYGCYSSSTGTATTSAPTGCHAYTTNGCYTWVVPAGVTSFSAITVGSGSPGQRRYTYHCCCYNAQNYCGGIGGAGGGNAHINCKSTTPGFTWTIQVNSNYPCGYGLAGVLRPGYNAAVFAYNGAVNNGPGPGGGGSYCSCGCIAFGNKGGGGGYWTQTGSATIGAGGGGGGAGGYAGGKANSNYSRGGDGSNFCGYAGRCGGGGGGSRGNSQSCGYGGGGVGIYGQGGNGSGGGCPPHAGYGGSGGNNGSGYSGGSYGGASGGGGPTFGVSGYINGYSQGAVRIKWGSGGI